MFRRFLTLFFHELRMQLVTPATYVAGTLFLAGMGFVHWYALLDASRNQQDWLPSENLFRLHGLPAILLIPLLTMRSFAEERRQGTLAALLTTPVGPHAVTLAKFASVYVLYLGLWALSLLYPVTANAALVSASADPRLLGAPALTGGMLFVAASAPLYIAVGIFCSSLTRSVLIAGVTSLVIITALMVGHHLLYLAADTYAEQLGWLRNPAKLLNTAQYAEDFVRGVIDTRPFLQFGAFTILGLGATALVVESKA